MIISNRTHIFIPLFTLGLMLFLFAPIEAKGAPLVRTANTTLRMPATFPIVGYGMTNAFDDLTFTEPVVITSPPGETNRIFVVEKSGRIFVITNLSNPTKTEFLDASEGIFSLSEAGLLG